MSQIATIFTTLAGAAVTAGSIRVTGYTQATLKNNVTSIDLPVRILSLMHEGQAGVTHRTFGGTKMALAFEWTMTDVCLWQSVGHGLGLAELEPELAAYMGGYADWIRANGTTNKWSITGCALTPGLIEYPAGSGNLYFGVTSNLTIYEVI